MEIYSENKKAGYDYEILEKFEAGLVLTGQEVKSIKTGHISLTGAYVVIRANPSTSLRISTNEPWLIGAKIPPYQPKNAPADYNPERSRKILLNKKEINYLTGKVNERGFSLIPLKIYNKNGRVKIEFGLAKGKKKFNKKESIKKREVEREILRHLSQN